MKPASSVRLRVGRTARSVIFTGSSRTGSVRPAPGAAEDEVDLHVHQAGDEGEIGEFDDLVGVVGDRAVGTDRVMRLPSTRT